jgi:cold-inducible RNA-binding protein
MRSLNNEKEPAGKFYPFIQAFVILKFGWSDDRVAPLALPDPVPASRTRLSRLNGFQRKLLSPRPGKHNAGRRSSFRSLIVSKKLYVGNLTYNVNESDLEALFTPFGTVQSAQVIVDRETNRSKGFGFVEMDTDAQAQAAIQGLNGNEHDGRNLTVNEAKPRESRPSGGGYGGGGGGGGRSGGGGYGGGGNRY